MLIGNASLRGNTIRNNRVTLCGGGVMIWAAYPGFNQDAVVSNTADMCGGGIYLREGGTTITNMFLVDNQAPAGSGFELQASAVRLTHVTVARNRGGAGIDMYGYLDLGIYKSSLVTMTNSIFASHTIGISVTAGSTATLEATLWGSDAWANNVDWSGSGAVITGTVNLHGDPKFVSPNAGNYHISPNSAARDAGINAGVFSDVDGDPRPFGPGFDIGADDSPPR
jgi:hypothetical protein